MALRANLVVPNQQLAPEPAHDLVQDVRLPTIAVELCTANRLMDVRPNVVYPLSWDSPQTTLRDSSSEQK